MNAPMHAMHIDLAEKPPRARHKRRREWVVEAKKEQAREIRRQRLEGETLDAEELELRRELDATRPRTRADCAAVLRPCHFLSCRHNLALEVTPSGSIRSLEVEKFEELAESCALDVAERGGITLEEVGSLLGVTRERVRQIEERAAALVRRKHEEIDA